MALKEYEIEIQGAKHTVQLRPDDVQHYPDAVEIQAADAPAKVGDASGDTTATDPANKAGEVKTK